MHQITGTTKLFAILADPIHHVKTPQGINALFVREALDAVMVPLHVAPADLAATVAALRQVRNLDGFVVTVPHKTAMLALCDEATPAATRIGAVNVVRRTADGRLRGGMLDGDGFVEGLRSRGIDVAGRRIYVAGAGGAASAIVFALAEAGAAHITVANRTAEKARQLIDRLAPSVPSVSMAVGGADPGGHDIVVNATSLGLHPGDALPLDVEALQPEQTVAEIVMQPAETPLLAAARQRGCRLHFGAPMLESQLALMARFMRA